MIAVCDPGGGKTNTYDRVIAPVIESITSTGKNVQLESYTTAGIQKHQIDTKGYGLITGDEGHRFMSSINQKQLKGESERSQASMFPALRSRSHLGVKAHAALYGHRHLCPFSNSYTP